MTRTIKVSDEHWKELNSMKNPGDSFDDVIGRLIEHGKLEVEIAESDVTAEEIIDELESDNISNSDQ